MTTPEVAAALGMSEDAIRNRLRRGLMRGRRIGPIWTVTKAEVDRWRAHPRMRAPKTPRK